jgi:hypothetical protein
MAGVAAWGQQCVKPSLDVAVVYNLTLANPVANNDFWLQGGSVQLHGQFWHGLGVVADLSGVHAANMNHLKVGLDLITTTFGPRYTWTTPYHHTALFGQFLVGDANGLHSVFPSRTGYSDSAFGLALLAGGGVNVPLKHNFTARAFEAEWLRTQLPNSTTGVQNNLRLGAGMAYRF